MAVQKIGLEAVLEMGSFSANLKGYISGINQMERATDSAASSASKSGQAFSSFGVGVAAGIGAAVGSAVIGGIKMAADAIYGLGREALTAVGSFEMMGLAFNNMVARDLARAAQARGAELSLVDAREQAIPVVQDLLKWTQQLAIQSPFTQEGVAGTFRLAQAYGFAAAAAQGLASGQEGVIDAQSKGIMTAERLTQDIIDFTAGSGQSEEVAKRVALALGQIQARGKLAGQEVMQLTEAGISVDQILSEAFGKSRQEIVEMREAGLIPADKAIEAIAQSLEKDYGGAAKRATGTISGLMSSLEDIKAIGLRELFTATFDALKPLIGGFVDLAASNPEAAFAPLRAIGKRVGESIAQVVARIQELIGAFQAGGLSGLATTLGIPPNVLTGISTLTMTVSTLAAVISGALMTAFDWLNTTGFPMMRQALDFVIQNWDTFSGALIGIGAVIAGAAIVGSIAAIAAVIASIATPIGLVVAAAALLGAAWTSNFLGIRDTLIAFWAIAQPIAAEFVAWYGGQMIAGIQQLAAIWNSVLMPAFQAAGAFIQSSVIPAISQIYTWLATNIPAAVNTLAGIWNGVLLPAFKTASDWITTYLTPAIMALGNFISAVLNIAVTAAAGLWQNVLYPALLQVGNFLSAQLNPGLTATGNVITTVLGPAIDMFVAGGLALFQQGLQGIQNALTWVTTKLNEMTSALNNVTLPDWLQPGSPTPFEIGLRGIADILGGKLSKSLGEFGGIAPPIFAGLADSVLQIKTGLAEMAEGTLTQFASAMGSAGSAMVSNFEEADTYAERLSDTLADLRNQLSSVSGYAQTAGSAFSSFNDAAGNIYGQLIPALQSLVEWLNQVASAAAEAASNVGSVGSSAGEAGGPGFQHGANFIVPSGFTNDSFPFRAETGERVIVMPRPLANQPVAAAGGGVGGVNLIFENVTITTGMDLEMFGAFVERRVARAMGGA